MNHPFTRFVIRCGLSHILVINIRLLQTVMEGKKSTKTNHPFTIYLALGKERMPKKGKKPLYFCNLTYFGKKNIKMNHPFTIYLYCCIYIFFL